MNTQHDRKYDSGIRSSRFMIEFIRLLRSRLYMVITILSAIATYGYNLTHSSIGTDDPAVSLYYREGLAPYIGRWTIFLLGKVLHINEYAPFFVDFVGVILLLIGATLWVSLLQSLSEHDVVLSEASCGLVSALFISSTFISELWVFSLHGGIGLGYILISIALYYFVNGLDGLGEQRAKAGLRNLALALLLLTVAVGLYETFALCFVVGAVLIFLLRRFSADHNALEYRNYKLWLWISCGCAVLALMLILRFLMLSISKLIYDPASFSNHIWVYFKPFGDNFEQLSNLGMTLKRFVSLYWLHAIVYLPVAVLALSLLSILVYSVYYAIKKHDFAVLLASLALFVFPPMMAVVEGHVTKYRSAQYALLVSSFAVFTISGLIKRKFSNRKIISAVWLLFVSIIVFNQCSDSNRYFYLDYEKYLYERTTATIIYDDLVRNHDISKPIMFVGEFTLPPYIREESCVSYNSPQYRIISAITNLVDVHWKEKFFIPEGYCYLDSLNASVLVWGADAFDKTSTQGVEFFNMIGLRGLRAVTDPELIRNMWAMLQDYEMPKLFHDGYILEGEECIVINLAN